MSTSTMLDNIQGQPDSHRGVLAIQQSGPQTPLTRSAEILRKATSGVIFTGMGGSLFAMPAAVSHLQQHGYPVQVAESAELLHYGTATLRAGGAGVVVSRSGGSIEPVLLAEKMRQAGMTVIAVTNVPGSRLEEIAHLTLHIGAQADNLIAVQTYTGTTLTLLLLAEEVTHGSANRLSEACSASLPALGTYIEQCLQASDNWRDWLSKGPLYLLGRGPALGSVYEGALLMHETAKVPAVGMSSGQFRHGPAEILSGDFCAVVFGSPLATRPLERSLANDLHAAGARVHWIGPDPADERGAASLVPSLVQWPQVAPDLAPLFEIVPMQVAAYRLALWRGITPGDFRFVSEVTATESGFLSPSEPPNHA